MARCVECETHLECDDGNECTDHACSSVSGLCSVFNHSRPCSNGIWCDGTEACSGGLCSTVAGTAPCLGNGPCNSTCNEAEASCAAPVGSPCTDTGPSSGCTVTACVTGGTCGVVAAVEVGTACDNGDPCATAGACAFGGVCVGSCVVEGGCGSHGTCCAGLCDCDDGWGGTACASRSAGEGSRDGGSGGNQGGGLGDSAAAADSSSSLVNGLFGSAGGVVAVSAGALVAIAAAAGAVYCCCWRRRLTKSGDASLRPPKRITVGTDRYGTAEHGIFGSREDDFGVELDEVGTGLRRKAKAAVIRPVTCEPPGPTRDLPVGTVLSRIRFRPPVDVANPATSPPTTLDSGDGSGDGSGFDLPTAGTRPRRAVSIAGRPNDGEAVAGHVPGVKERLFVPTWALRPICLVYFAITDPVSGEVVARPGDEVILMDGKVLSHDQKVAVNTATGRAVRVDPKTIDVFSFDQVAPWHGRTGRATSGRGVSVANRAEAGLPATRTPYPAATAAAVGEPSAASFDSIPHPTDQEPAGGAGARGGRPRASTVGGGRFGSSSSSSD